MPRPTPPPLSLALTVLRSAQGWTQGELAETLGISAKVLSRYETGRSTLSREALETMVATMGLGPEAIDQTLLYLQGILTEPESSGSPLDPTKEERRIIERAAAAKAEATRAELLASLSKLRAEQDRRDAQRLWEYLKGRPARERLVLIEGGREYRSWALCERLCYASKSAAANDASEAVELAELAVRVAELVPQPEPFRLRLLGFAWAFVANSHRVDGDHPSADQAFARSDELLNRGTPGGSQLLDEARPPDLKASLRRHQDRFGEALKLHEQALALAKPGDHGSYLLNKAKTLEEMELYEEALSTLKQAEPLVDPQRVPRDLCVLKFNVVANLCHLERYSIGEALLPEVRGLVVRLGTGLDNVRLRWLEGKVAAGLRRWDEALAAFSQVRAELTTRGITFDSALVTLELAMVHLELGRTGEVKTLARQMVRIFQSQGGHREALAALKLYLEAAEKEAVTVEFTRRLIAFLHRARRNPGLRFEV